jgi:hypothetical protein
VSETTWSRVGKAIAMVTPGAIAPVTITPAAPPAASLVASTIAIPGLTAVTIPVAETLATFGTVDDH